MSKPERRPFFEGPGPLHPLLAAFLREWQQQTLFSGPQDWVFPSEKLNGKQPRVPNMLVEDHLRPAAAKAGVLAVEVNEQGVLGESPAPLGFHNLRHSLASFLVDANIDPKTVRTCCAKATHVPPCSGTRIARTRPSWRLRGRCWRPSCGATSQAVS